MANLYYNAAVDTAWDELGNWWNDAAFTDPALALPADGDTVYLEAQMDIGPSTTVTLNHIYVNDSSTGGGESGVVFTGAIGNATFSDNSYNSGIVTGDATFNGFSYNNGTVTGDATFNDNSYNSGTVQGIATFTASSFENVSFGTAGSYNFTSLTPVTFTVTGEWAYDSSSWTFATAGPTWTFNDSSQNGGTVSGDATFNSASINYGTVSGDATFYGTASNAYDFVSAQGDILGNATFYDTSFNGGAYVRGDATFNDYSSSISGAVLGDAIFNDYSFLQYLVGGFSTFNNFSYAYGAANAMGGAEFNDDSICNTDSYSNGFGTTTFKDNSSNTGTITCEVVTFRNSSRNTGTIEGSATIYFDGGDGLRPIGGTVNGTVTYIGFPPAPAIYYNNATEDGAWDTLGNWWRDSAFTIPAFDLPLENTDVYLEAQMDSGPSVGVTLSNIYVATSEGGGSFGVAFTGASGPATFNDASHNEGTINGNARFNAPSTFNNGTITGNATFFGANGNSGTCDSDAFFNDTTTNSGTVTGKAMFALTAAASQIKTYSGTTQGTFSGDVVISAGSDQTLARLLNLPWFINL